MRYRLLDLLASPETGAPFILVGGVEMAMPYVGPYGLPASRVSPDATPVGVAPAGTTGAFFEKHLKQHATEAAHPDRDKHVIVTEGLLVSVDTGMWYPIVDTIPEILPRSLRDWNSHLDFLKQIIAPRIPAELTQALIDAVDKPDTTAKQGDSYKKSEISLIGKIEDKAAFLGPGLHSPFNPFIYDHPAHLIKGFANCLPFLNLQHGSTVLDSGSGYGWTTEWLMKLGVEAVGIDISRIYPDTGRKRMGPNNQPHLVIGDAENLPFTRGVFDAVLGFDAFHHIPNRPAAMRQYERVMKEKGRVVLLEPGEHHKEAEISVNAMDTYGIMEIGMTLAEVQGYIDGIETFGPARQVFLRPHYSDEDRESIPASELFDTTYIGWGLYVIEKGAPHIKKAPAPAKQATGIFKKAVNRITGAS